MRHTIDGLAPKWRTDGLYAIGKSVEIPPHLDLWMRGARTGTVHSISTNPGLRTVYARVRMDHPQVKRLVTVEFNDLKFL